MRIHAFSSYAAVMLAALSLTACASRELAQETGDPFEPANRAVFAVNQTLDDVVVGPSARVYDAVTPAPVQTGVRNFMSNLNQPVVFANALLQGDVHAAGDTVGRFVMNTTIGVGGVFDVATHEGVPQHRRDFGQTLAVWGVGDGPYLVLPLIGPVQRSRCNRTLCRSLSSSPQLERRGIRRGLGLGPAGPERGSDPRGSRRRYRQPQSHRN
jgi:phospholipid-binding lipoprotein MlaA